MPRKKKQKKLKVDVDVEVEKKDESSSYYDVEEVAKNLVLDNKQDSQLYYDEKFKKFNYFDRMYIKGSAKRNVPQGRANLELPLAFQQIEPFVSTMTEMMFSESPYIPFVPRGPEDEQTAEDITDFTQWQLEEGNLVPVCIRFLRNLGKYGTAIMKMNWEVDVDHIPEIVETPQPVLDPNTLLPMIDPMTGQPQMEMVQEEVIKDIKKHDGPMFHNLSIFDFLVPKSAASINIQKLEWCIHRTWRNPDEILDNPNYTKNRDKIKQYRDETLDSDEETSSRSVDRITDQSKQRELDQHNSQGSTKKYEGKIEVLEWWGDFRHTKDGDLEPTLIVVAAIGDEVLILRLDRNPLKYKFKPFIAANDYPIEGEFYGYGELDHIKGLIEESTALRNARLDVANISLNRGWLVERQAGVNIRSLYTSPNKIILTNDNNGIKPIDMAQVTPSSVNELARIDFDIQNTTEIINPRQDASNVGAAFGGTATGVNFLSSRTNLRLTTKARLMEETFFKPLAMMMNWYNKDLLTEESYFRVTNNQPSPYRTIGPDAFLTEIDYKPTSAPDRISRMTQREDLSYMMQVIAQIEGVKPGTSNLVEILQQVWKTTGFPHPEKYVNPPQVTLLQLPDGKVVDEKGQPPTVIPVDEKGKPIQQGGPSG